MKLYKILKITLYALLGLLLSLALIGYFFVNYHPVFGGKPEGERLARMQKAINFKEAKFTNFKKVKETFGWEDYKKMFAKLWEGNPKKAPSKPLPFQRWNKEEVSALSDTLTTAVWYGHSAFYLKMDGKHILLDPMFGDYPSPLPYIIQKRFNDTLPIAIEDLPTIDVIVFSHDHYDHLDYGSVLKLKDKTKHFVVPLGVGAHLERWGVPKEKITELYWDEKTTINGIEFICTPAQHFSGRGLSDKMRTLWASWVIHGSKDNVFFSGDSGYFDGFKKIGEQYGPFDLALMECGQYNELWVDIHMLPEQTAQACLDVKGKLLMPIHWGAFTLSVHDWNEPVKRLSKSCKEMGIDLATPIIGEPIVINQKRSYSQWWF